MSVRPPSTSPPGAAAPDWDRIANSEEFKHLLAIKRLFIVPAFVFFLIYYFLFPVLIGFAPKFMSTPVIGAFTLAYAFAFSQFFVGWIIAWFYLRASAKFDLLAGDILARVADQKGEK
jgi:uncharacterized membrane protein (DUF485 family)